MYILSEKELEDILVLHPKLIENGLSLIERQGYLENRRTDLTFKDSSGSLLLVELKRDIINEDHIEQIADYIIKLKKSFDKPFRAMLVGQTVPQYIRDICQKKQINGRKLKQSMSSHIYRK